MLNQRFLRQQDRRDGDLDRRPAEREQRPQRQRATGYRRRTIAAVDDMTWSIARGEAVGYIGANGARKAKYAALMAEAVDLGDVPEPLEGVVNWIWGA